MPRKILSILFFSLVLASTGISQKSATPTTPPAPKEPTARVMQITLPEAIQAAMKKNFTLQERAYDPRIATERLRATKGAFDPSLYASAHSRADKAGGNFATDSTGNATRSPFTYTNAFDTSVGVSGKTPIGTIYDVGQSVAADNSNRRGYTRYDSFLGITLTQPLLKNFGTGVNMAAIRTARADLSIADWSMRQEMINVITDCVRAYSELCFAIEYLDVEERARELAAQLVEDNKQRERIGTMIPLDILQAQTELTAREERILLAQRNVADRENALKQIISDEVHSLLGLRIRPAPPQFSSLPHPNITRDITKAFDLRPDYRQALLEIQKRNINIVYSRNQALPQLNLVASFGLNGIDTHLGDSLVRSAGIREGNLAASVGAVFSIPIPNNEGIGNREAAQLQIAKSLVALQRLEQNIIIDIDNAAGHVETMLKRTETSSIARTYAAETHEAAKGRLDEGAGTTFEVLQFQRDLANAEGNELRARADYINALADYASVTATTLESNNVILEVADKQIVKKKN